MPDIGNLWALLSKQPARSYRASSPLSPECETALSGLMTVLASYVDSFTHADVQVPESVLEEVEQLVVNDDEQGLKDWIEAQWAALPTPGSTAAASSGGTASSTSEDPEQTEEGGSPDPYVPAVPPDDAGRCIQGSFWWFHSTVCMPTPNCLLTAVGCAEGWVRLGWCFHYEEPDPDNPDVILGGCRCEFRDFPIAAIMLLLAVATLFFSPALTVPVRVIIMRLIQRGVVAPVILP